MPSLDDILRLSKEMGVEITESNKGKHYILNDHQLKVEFDIDMLAKTDAKSVSCTLDLQAYSHYSFAIPNSLYNLSDDKFFYKSAPFNVNQSMINAA